MQWQVSKIWSGVCWIIGGGSSVKEQFRIPDDLVPETKDEFIEFGNYLKPIHNDHVIGVNLAAFLGNWVDVAFWADNDTYLDYKAWFDAFSGLKVSLGSRFYQRRYKSVKFLHRNHDEGITQNNAEISWVGKNSGSAAINLAYHLGCTEIRLLGFDMKNHESGRMHFHTGYPTKDYSITNKQVKEGNYTIPRREPINPYQSKFLPGFAKIAEDAEKLGIKIINVSPDSEIKEFPKVSLNELIEIEKTDIIPIKQKEKIEVRCVLKSGGDFDKYYVYRLKEAVRANTTLDFTFTCLTDLDFEEADINVVKLKHNWPGWWSKIELFRPDLSNNPSIYFDLDTLIVGNIDELLKASQIKEFIGLRGFNQKFQPPNGINFASGIMMGSFALKSIVYHSFLSNPEKIMNVPRKGWKFGDQGFIADYNNTDDRIQNYLPMNYIIGKKYYKKSGIPEDARVIAWSGRPRLHETGNYSETEPINQSWKKYYG